MPSSPWRALGTGNIVGNLRADLKRATSLVHVIGPWIDAFFAQIVVSSLPANVALHVVTRAPTGATASFAEHASAARDCFEDRPNTFVKLLANLHAKLVSVDEEIVYCGSANWYRYSLEESRELVLRGPIEATAGLLDEVQRIWDQAANEPPQGVRNRTKATVDQGYQEEVIDPIAAAKLKAVPGAFVISNSPSKPPRR